MAETNATILIPDISGFTEFMTTTELNHASHAINYLIDAIVNAVGEEYEVKTEAKRWRIRVSGLLYKRVAFAEAINYYVDITPAEEIERLQYQAASFHTGKRQSKIGRPTKKQRRDIDDFMGE